MKMKTVFRLCLMLTIVSAMTVAVQRVAAVQTEGAAEISIFGGKKGDVPFLHHVHQKTIGDCMACHDLFPKEPEAIKKLKAQGELKKKQVMKDRCISCHKAMKAAGEKAGPTACKQCHTK